MPTRCLIILTVHSTFRVCFQWRAEDPLIQLSKTHHAENTFCISNYNLHVMVVETSNTEDVGWGHRLVWNELQSSVHLCLLFHSKACTMWKHWWLHVLPGKTHTNTMYLTPPKAQWKNLGESSSAQEVSLSKKDRLCVSMLWSSFARALETLFGNWPLYNETYSHLYS
jgi:hypothetical protein